MVLSTDVPLIKKIETQAGITNDEVLTSDERSRAQAILYDMEDRIKLQLSQRTDHLLPQHRWDEDRAHKFRIALAPHKLLPAEILAEIFVHCLYDTTNTVPYQPHDAPWSLGQVCSLWRDISRRETRLWGNASILVTFADCKDLERARNLLPSFIPLYLEMELTVTDYGRFWRKTSPDMFANVLSAILEVREDPDFDLESTYRSWTVMGPLSLACRLRELEIRALDEGGFIRLLSGIVPWSQLTSLTIDGDTLHLSTVLPIICRCSSLQYLDIKFSSPDEGDHQAVPVLPHLRSLSIVLDEIPTSFLQWGSIWGCISQLNLGTYIGFESLTTILGQCSRLRVLTSRGWVGGPMHEIGRSISLPCLESLTLTFLRGPWLFRSLFIPSLRKLDIRSRAEIDFSLVQQMLVSSKCSLSSFRLEHVVKQREDIAHGVHNLLTAIPTVVDIDCGCIPFNGTTLHDISTGALLPKMETLRCYIATAAEFVDMVESRVNWEAHLGRVTLRLAYATVFKCVEPASDKALLEARLTTLRNTQGVDSRFEIG